MGSWEVNAKGDFDCVQLGIVEDGGFGLLKSGGKSEMARCMIALAKRSRSK